MDAQNKETIRPVKFDKWFDEEFEGLFLSSGKEYARVAFDSQQSKIDRLTERLKLLEDVIDTYKTHVAIGISKPVDNRIEAYDEFVKNDDK